jgi:thymidylate synthase ThyX
MKITLIDYQKNALDLLIFTRGTRLKGVKSINDISNWTEQQKLNELAKIKDTIKSSWEFVSYIFSIENVSRNFTHQLVRTRTQSYAQESLRAVDASESGVYNLGLNIDYDHAVCISLACYKEQIKQGVPIQDARGCLPTDILTNIVVKTDLRTLHDTALTRLCVRTAGEYQNVFKEIKNLVVGVHPWAEDFINVACVQTGICCFPRYTECPVQKYTVKVSNDRKSTIRNVWEKTNHVADPSGAS